MVVVGRPPRGARRELCRRRQPAGRPVARSRTSIGPGRRVIATIAGPRTWPGHRPARRLPRRAARGRPSRPIPSLEAVADFTQEGGAAAMDRPARRPPRHRRACSRHRTSWPPGRSARARRAAGRRVPEDVAVVGFDDSPVAATTRPRSPASASRSRRWARRWPVCSSTASRRQDRVPRRVILATESHSARFERREARALSRPATGGGDRHGSPPHPTQAPSNRSRSIDRRSRRGGVERDDADQIRPDAAGQPRAGRSPSSSPPVAARRRPRHRPSAAPDGRRRRPPRRPARPSPDAARSRRRRSPRPPGPNGGVVVRWFIGLGAGGQPAADRRRADVRRGLQQVAEGRLHLASRSTTTTSPANILKTQIAAGNPPDIIGPVGVEGLNLFRDQLLDLAPLIESTGFDMSEVRPGARRLLQDRQGRRHDRRPVRDLPVVPLLQQEAVRRGQAAVPADQGRRPCTRASRGTWTPFASSA